MQNNCNSEKYKLDFAIVTKQRSFISGILFFGTSRHLHPYTHPHAHLPRYTFTLTHIHMPTCPDTHPPLHTSTHPPAQIHLHPYTHLHAHLLRYTSTLTHIHAPICSGDTFHPLGCWVTGMSQVYWAWALVTRVAGKQGKAWRRVWKLPIQFNFNILTPLMAASVQTTWAIPSVTPASKPCSYQSVPRSSHS